MKETAPWETPRKQKNQIKLEREERLERGDTFSPTDFQGTIKRHRDYKTTTLLPWNHWAPICVLFDLHAT